MVQHQRRTHTLSLLGGDILGACPRIVGMMRSAKDESPASEGSSFRSHHL